MSGRDDANEARRNYRAPYSPHHQIPTIEKYRKEKEARQSQAQVVGEDEDGWGSSTAQRLRDYWQGSDSDNEAGEQQGQDEGATRPTSGDSKDQNEGGHSQAPDDDTDGYEDEEPVADTSEVGPISADPKERRKGLKKRKEQRAERQVTDPVTHLPVTIHDFTTSALKETPENDPAFGTTTRTAAGLKNKKKTNKQLQKETHEMEKGRESMQALYPPPNYDVVRSEIVDTTKLGITIGLAGSATILAVAVILGRLLSTTKPHWFAGTAKWLVIGALSASGIWVLIAGIRDWMSKRIDHVWEDEMWEASRGNVERDAKAHETESVVWLNSLLGAVWPLVNPDLFTSLADTLEDVMQASLPKLVRMVAVDDVGQGSQSVRILGIRWLPTGAAARSVGQDGKLKSADESKQGNDRKVSGQGEMEEGDDNNDGGDKEKQEDGTEKEMVEGMEAEEGDFINVEIAFAYRARTTKNAKDISKDMHLFLAFYLPGNIKIPVWVDVRGFIGTMRMRLQLAPDPPFFALCTMTFLGQPKVDLSCVPLVKHGLNLMDLPLISNFVQSSVDAAMAEYVAPKSLTLDLKDMLAGDDFKKDTTARGVIVVHIKRGYDFKMGDTAIPLIKEGGSDPYVSVGWAKFGKALWSTRVLMSEMNPCWMETAYLLVTPEELNVDERLRVQLWDTDRFSADDDLGRIEVDLKTIMRNDASNGKMQDRTDGFRALQAGEDMPGKLEWSVGYFSKTRIQECQLQQQTFDPEIRSMEQLKQKVDTECKEKLREAGIKEGRNPRDRDELEQQKAQLMKSKQDAMMISAPPPQGYPSGIFSIQIHQITGLELQVLNKHNVNDEADDEAESGDDMPSPYCTVIINHSKTFKTRTKPKNAKPFFNAGVERFIPDWRSAEVHVSVRDARVKEDDPLIGIVHFSLGDIFKERSQIQGYYPLVGGVGYGRVRISLVWRSVQLQFPPHALGWNYGTLEVRSGVSADDVPHDLQNMKIRFHSDIGYGKMYSGNDQDKTWHTKKTKSLKVPVARRYSSALAVQFRDHGVLGDKIAAFAILWLRDIPDEEEQEITLPVWKGDYKKATASCQDDCGEKLGSIKVKLTFWSGLGSAHSKWAGKDPNLRDVVEVLDCARDHLQSNMAAKKAGVVMDDASDSGSDDDDSSAEEHEEQRTTDGEETSVTTTSDGSKKSKRGVMDSLKDYKTHMKSEHRRNRGLMQWKIPRTAEFAWHKVEKAGDKAKGVFQHHTRHPGIETEV